MKVESDADHSKYGTRPGPVGDAELGSFALYRDDPACAERGCAFANAVALTRQRIGLFRRDMTDLSPFGELARIVMMRACFIYASGLLTSAHNADSDFATL
ncbi:MAG: hypothetical protein ACNA7Q_05490 [Rhodobacterales bacterium]